MGMGLFRFMMKKARPDRSTGFTLLEILLALALAATIMTSVLLLAAGLSDIWRGTTPVRNLEVHSRQVVDFLKRGFARALPVQTDGTAYVFLDYTSGELNQTGPPLLSWEVQASDGIVSWGVQPLPYVLYQLEVIEDVGLALYWQSRLEVDFEEIPPRQTLISPFVTRMEYHYYDAEDEVWELQDKLRYNTERLYDIPNRVKLFFESEDDAVAYMINLPRTGGGVPLY